MKNIVLALMLSAILAVPAAYAAEKSANKPQFHPPQTEAEKALDKALWIEEIDRTKRYQEVVAWLKGHVDLHSFSYGDYFTRHYLKKWSDTQADMVAACKKNTTPSDGVECEPFSLTCGNLNNRNLSYAYRTLKSDKNKAVISLLPPGWDGDGDVFHMAKEGTVWKIEDTDCAHNIWRTKK